MPIPIVNLSKRKRNKKKRSHRARNTNNLTPISLSTELNQTSVKMGYINCRSVRNKSISIYTFIIENNFDLLAIVETWLNGSDPPHLYLNLEEHINKLIFGMDAL